jgi:hypothetical protein
VGKAARQRRTHFLHQPAVNLVVQKAINLEDAPPQVLALSQDTLP